MKKILSVILVLSMLVSVSFSISAATVDGLIYKNSSGEKTVDMKPGNMTVEANVTGDANDTSAQLISAVYDKYNKLISVGVSPETDIKSKTENITAAFNVDTVDGAAVKNFIWKDKTGFQPLMHAQEVLIELEVIERPGYQVLNWSTTAGSVGHTYKILKDGAVLAQNLTADRHAYVDKTQGSGASSYQIKAVKNGYEIGASNIVSSTPTALEEISKPDASGSWFFNPNGSVTTENGYKYTESQLKIIDNSAWWILSDYDAAEDNNTTRSPGGTVAMIKRGGNFVVCFGEEIKKKGIVSVSFDFWGSRKWQNGSISYKNASGTVTTEGVQVKEAYYNYSYQMSTGFELSDYGCSGQYGFVIQYPGTDDRTVWVKNLKVSIGEAVVITADENEAGYSEILPCGNELSEMHGNQISGAVLRDGSYAIGYQYKNVDGVDAFYLTQIYDTNASSSADVVKGYLAFKVDTDKFPKSPTAAKNLYLITEYYDGTAGDMSTRDFEISYTAKSWNWANSSATNVTMANDNTWKTHVLPLGDIYLGVSNAADSAAITYRIPTAQNGYNKNGILIRKVILCDETYKNYYTSEAYTNSVAAYEQYLAKKEKLDSLDKFADGVEIDFNKAGANSTPDTDYWNDIEANGIALRCDSVNDDTDNSYRGLQYGQYGPSNDKRWAVSTASYWGARASSGRVSYLYFKVDKNYIDEEPQNVEIEVTYYDNVGDKVKDTNRITVLNKNASSGGSKVGTYHAPTNTGVWKTVTIRLEDAVFDKSDEGYGDFRLSLETGASDPKQLIISKIKVRNMTAKTQDAIEIAEVPTVYIAADSIAANYALAEYGNHTEYGDRYGWGEKLDFGAASVNNRAVAGQSTKNFNFQGIYDRLKKGDYVLICFGHNDSTAGKENIYVTTEQYKANLKKVINTVLSKGATPVVMTSIPTYNPDTYTVNTGDAIDPYRAAAMETADECGILGFDLCSAFKAELESMPDEEAKACYQNENDEDWHKRVHLTESGAECAAELITNALKNSSKIIGLQQYIE